MTLGDWLNAQLESDPELGALKKFANEHAPNWPKNSNSVAEYLKVLNELASEPEKSTLIERFGGAIQDWTEATPRKLKWREIILPNLGVILLLLAGFAICSILAWGIFNGSFLPSIAKPENARGLITFLFAFSTIAIIIIVAISTLYMKREEVEFRFQSAKDLITILIGVLGTILGFYFGSMENEAAGRGVYVANVEPSSPTVSPGQSVALSGMVVGGTAPYQIEFSFDDQNNSPQLRALKFLLEKRDEGKFTQQFNIVSETPATTATYTITIQDANGTLARSRGTLSVVPKA
ncbi:hypothetical protein ACU4I5_26970 (plasmid) [Ensifer adhaerens]